MNPTLQTIQWNHLVAAIRNDGCILVLGPNIATIEIDGGSRDKTAKLWFTTQPFLDQKVHQFTLQELYDAGTILTEEDLKKVKQKEK